MGQSDSKSSSEDHLASKIFNALVRTQDGRRFLPQACLRRLIEPDSVVRELTSVLSHTHTHEKIKYYANAVCGETEVIHGGKAKIKSFRKIFALLVMTGTPSWIALFLDKDVSDLDLPLTLLKSHGKFEIRRQDTSENPSTVLLICFKRRLWLRVRIDSFESYQWMLLAPFFSPDDCGGPKHYVLSSHHILPFPTPRQKNSVSGIYHRRVWKRDFIQIHEGQHNFSNKELSSRGFEIKKLYAEDREHFTTAVNTLKHFSGERTHRHAVPLLATYEQFEILHLIFYRSECDLFEYWHQIKPSPVFDYENVLWVAEQCAGLADALLKLHMHRSFSTRHLKLEDGPPHSSEVVQIEQNGYHGDISTGHIQWYDDGHGAGASLKGTLKISGFEQGELNTDLRRTRPPKLPRGVTYKPPEHDLNSESILQLDDIWGLGCVYLDFVAWMLGGGPLLDSFARRRLAPDPFQGGLRTDKYFVAVKSAEMDHPGVMVKPEVSQFIDELHRHTNCTGYFHEILDIIQLDMLLVDSSHRKSCEEIQKALDSMYQRCRNDEDYATKTTPLRTNTVISKPNILHFSEKESRDEVERPIDPLVPVVPLFPEVSHPHSSQHSSIEKLKQREFVWEFTVDNRFAEKVLSQVVSLAELAHPSAPAKICDRCGSLNLMAGEVTFDDTMSDLEGRAQVCDLCAMLYDICGKDRKPKRQLIQLKQIQSILVMEDSDSRPVLSIVQAQMPEAPTPIQLGLRVLPKPRSDTFFDILKLWLWDCDSNHRGCQDSRPKRLPARLIDVGSSEAPKLRLLETREEVISSHKYIALSHPWGDPVKHPPFSTLRNDPSGAGHEIDKFKVSISYDLLPATFKNAVDCTRALKIHYLWIDSICIIQGPDGDFNEESKRMEDVFSGAYCVLAASRATGQRDGFLGERPQREYITLQKECEKQIYACKHIDNFRDDILEGSLNRRGWVLQERALAQRTIFFTENQTYFECGNGVRCETLAMMHNNMADFLGDPKFPDKVMRTSSRALKISFFQDLYRRYTRLLFTRDDDMPFAIAGLEKRLQRAFGTKGGYGIFDDGADGGLFHQSLLWQRGADEACLTPILFPVERNVKVPSWSWMAYKGGIDYMDLPSHTADWETDDIMPPWTMRVGNDDGETTHNGGSVTLTATVRDFALVEQSSDEARLVYDTGRLPLNEQVPQCVVVAKPRQGKTNQKKRNYILIVSETKGTTARGEKLYKRIGAGYLLGKYINLEKPGISGRIC